MYSFMLNRIESFAEDRITLAPLYAVMIWYKKEHGIIKEQTP